MKYLASKLPFLVVLITCIGFRVHCMEPINHLAGALSLPEQRITLKDLPQEIRHYIILLLLEISSRDTFCLLQIRPFPTPIPILKSAKEAFLSHDGSALLTEIYDSSYLWNMHTAQFVQLEGGANISAMALNHDNNLLLTGSANTISLWEPTTAIKIGILKGHSGRISSVLCSPDGKSILTAAYDQTVRLWDLTTRRQLMEVKVEEPLSISKQGKQKHHRKQRAFNPSIAFCSEGKSFFVESFDHTIQLWEIEKADVLLALKGHFKRINCLVCSPDGTLLLTASRDTTVWLWNIKTGQKVQQLECAKAPK
nr:hypothetical protein [Candidatus Dependentiae bacterium]